MVGQVRMSGGAMREGLLQGRLSLVDAGFR
jgi:hypothetical protein